MAQLDDRIDASAAGTDHALAIARLRELDEDLTRAVALPPIDSVRRQATTLNRTTTAATAAVLTVGALGAITIAAQTLATTALPLPIPVALAPAPTARRAPSPGAHTSPAPSIAQILTPGQHLMRLKPQVTPPPDSRTLPGGGHRARARH